MGQGRRPLPACVPARGRPPPAGLRGERLMAFDQLERPTSATLLDAELRDAHPTTIIEAAVAAFGDRLALVSSFGAESAVLLHLAAQVKRDIPVLFLDTGMLFGQTLDYRKQLSAK